MEWLAVRCDHTYLPELAFLCWGVTSSNLAETENPGTSTSGLVRVIKMGSVVPMAILTSVLPAWRPLAMANLLPEDWRLARLAHPGQAHAHQTGRKHPLFPSHHVPELCCWHFMHMTLDSQDNSPSAQEGESEAQRGSRTCPWTVGAKVRMQPHMLGPLESGFSDLPHHYFSVPRL